MSWSVWHASFQGRIHTGIFLMSELSSAARTPQHVASSHRRARGHGNAMFQAGSRRCMAGI